MPFQTQLSCWMHCFYFNFFYSQETFRQNHQILRLGTSLQQQSQVNLVWKLYRGTAVKHIELRRNRNILLLSFEMARYRNRFRSNRACTAIRTGSGARPSGHHNLSSALQSYWRSKQWKSQLFTYKMSWLDYQEIIPFPFWDKMDYSTIYLSMLVSGHIYQNLSSSSELDIRTKRLFNKG